MEIENTQGAYQTASQQKPDNFLVWSILATFLCCLPFGVVGIVFANKVDSLWNAGKHQEAIEAAKNAKMWTFISLGGGVLVYVIFMVMMFISALLG